MNREQSNAYIEDQCHAANPLYNKMSDLEKAAFRNTVIGVISSNQRDSIDKARAWDAIVEKNEKIKDFRIALEQIRFICTDAKLSRFNFDRINTIAIEALTK